MSDEHPMPKQPYRPPMDLANMRSLGVHHMIASCLDNACRHQALIDVSGYPADFEVTWFGRHAVCNKCGAKGRMIDVRPNWKERPGMPDDWKGRPV
jgi:hypothetical protein